jgi:hypothetical protein
MQNILISLNKIKYCQYLNVLKLGLITIFTVNLFYAQL